MGNDKPLFVFMSPTPDSLRQMRDDCVDEPKWFAYPIEKAGFHLHFKPTPKAGFTVLRRLLREAEYLCALIFNVGLFEVAACRVFGSRLRICSLFQWRAIENLPVHKRVCYRAVLDCSRAIAVYDAISECYVRKIYPRKPVLRIGLFADTDFFRPSLPHNGRDAYILCPGSNFRLEHTVLEVARHVPLRVIRYSNERRVRDFYSHQSHSLVDFRYNVSYREVRALLDDARCVLNIVDDTQVPAGIYAFCQALAMNQIIVTPNMHSSAGYVLPGGDKPYYTIDDPFDVNEWISLTKALIGGKLNLRGSPRELAERSCSIERSVADWEMIREILTRQ